MALVKTESTLMEDDDSSSISTSSLGTPTSCDDAPAKTGFPPRTKGDDVSCHRSDSSSLFSNVPSVKSGKTPSSRLSPSASSKSSGRAAPKDPPSDTKANATSVCSEIALSNKGVVQHTAVEAISPLAPMKKSVPREKRLSQDLQSNKRRCSDVVIANMEMCAGEKPELGAAGSMDDPNAEESLLQPVTSIETRAAQAAVSTDEKRPAKALSSIAQKRAAKISASMEEKKPVKALASTKEKIPAKVAALTKEKRPAKEAASTEETRPKAEGKKVANRSEKEPVGEGVCDVPKSPVKQAASIKKKKKVEQPHDCDVPKSYVKQTTSIQKKTKVEKSHDCDVPKSGMKQNSSINYTKVEETTVEKSHDCDVPKSPVKQTASVQKKTKVEEKKPATGIASIQKTNVSKKRRVKAKTSRMKTIIVPEEEEGEKGAENDDVEAETDLSVVEVSGTVADDHGSHDENNEDKKSEAKPPSVVDLSEEGDHSQQQAATATDPGTTSGDHTAHLSPAHSGVSVQFQVSAASSPPFSGGPKDSNKRFPSDSAKSESSTEGFVEPVKKSAAPVKLYLQIGVGARGRALRRRLRENTLAERRSEEELVKRRSEEDLAERRSEEEAAVTSTPRTRAARQKPVRATPPAAESGVVPVRAMREKKRQQVARETMEEKMAEDDSTLMSEQGWSAQKSKWAAPKEPVTPRGRGGGRGKRLKLDDAPSTDALSSEPSEGGKQTTSGGKQAIVNMSPVSVTAKRGTYSFRGSPSGPSSGGGMTRPRWVFLGKRGDPDEKCEGMDSGEQRGGLGEARSDECSEDLDSPELIVGSGPSSPSSSAAASVDGDDSSPPSMLPMGSCSALPSAALYEPPSRKRSKLDRRKAVQKAFDMFNNNASPSYTCTQSPEEGDNLPILVISPAFLKPAAQGGNVDSSKWLQSVFDHLEGDGENGEESMIDRCEVMRLKKQFARYKPIEMRQYMIKIAATQVHSWEYLNALQKVHLSLREGLYPRQLDTPGAIDLYSDPVVESCKRPLALARGENVMNLWTLPCALGRALAFQEVVDTLLKRERGSAAMFARPACHHVPMWRSRCPLCEEGGEDVNVLCGFDHCELMFHEKCVEILMSKEPRTRKRVSRKETWVCPFHGKKRLPLPSIPRPIDEVACGFSYINATAYALRVAKQLYPYQLLRTAIVDIDVHHGNGNQSVFYSDPSVLVISMHRGALVCERNGLPEFIGAGGGKGFNINLPLEVGDDDAVALIFLHMIILPVLKVFSPHLLVVALGFDALDMRTESGTVPGMDCRFSPKVYGDFVGNLKNAVPRICLHSEGGYDPDQVGHAAVGCIKALLGEWPLTTEEQVKGSLNSQQMKVIMSRVNKLKYRLVNLGWDI